MPIYEYRRPDGSTFEVIQKFSDDPLTVDPESGVPVERVLSAPAIHFKGTGFHNTDYGTRRRNREKASQDGSTGTGSTASADAAAPASSKPADAGSGGGTGGTSGGASGGNSSSSSGTSAS